MIKKHLLEGVKKGALTPEQAEAKFQTWMTEKSSKVQAKMDSLAKGKRDSLKDRIEAENKVKEARAQELAKKRADAAAKEAKSKVADVAEEAAAPESENTEA